MRPIFVFFILLILTMPAQAGIFDNEPAESAEHFKSSCKTVNAGMYRDLKSGSGKMYGKRVQFEAVILSIEPISLWDLKYKKNLLRAHMSGHRDVFVIEFYGELKLKEGDKVRVFGEGDVLYSVKDKNNKWISFPSILAKYIEDI